MPGQAKVNAPVEWRPTVAQNTPVQLGASRIPMMDASLLDARTRPPEQETTPIWLHHRLQRRHMQESTSPPRRAREWIMRLAGRSRT